MRWVIVACALLLPPVLWATDLAAGGLAYFNFASGVVLGVTVGLVWRALPGNRINAIDVGLVVFVVWSAVQLMRTTSAGGSHEAHQLAETSWGRSNYVGGVLAVAAFVLIARSSQIERGRWVLWLGSATAVLASVETQSRGALIALSVGALAVVWNMGERPATRAVVRLVAVGLPFVAARAFADLNEARTIASTNAVINVDTRVELWRAAVQQFVSSPLTGTGWASLRSVPVGVHSESQTFAHNAIVSFPQIGGLLFGVPLLIILAGLTWRALRYGNAAFRAPVLAAIAISMTDPFLEGMVGGALVWMVFCLAIPVGEVELRGPRTVRPGGAQVDATWHTGTERN
ncbi:O-antigen ligase [Cellulomonas sp. Leaf334]|uniref:O-antigen ligase family protein n=1 Tax=Cellulomonas sp. Leaf334 TaxID=1736339 RepID=UPI0012E2D9A7|nr:O-antigen ligase family protein [Cellulomonas sp. Leaf334]